MRAHTVRLALAIARAPNRHHAEFLGRLEIHGAVFNKTALLGTSLESRRQAGKKSLVRLAAPGSHHSHIIGAYHRIKQVGNAQER